MTRLYSTVKISEKMSDIVATAGLMFRTNLLLNKSYSKALVCHDDVDYIKINDSLDSLDEDLTHIKNHLDSLDALYEDDHDIRKVVLYILRTTKQIEEWNEGDNIHSNTDFNHIIKCLAARLRWSAIELYSKLI